MQMLIQVERRKSGTRAQAERRREQDGAFDDVGAKPLVFAFSPAGGDETGPNARFKPPARLESHLSGARSSKF